MLGVAVLFLLLIVLSTALSGTFLSSAAFLVPASPVSGSDLTVLAHHAAAARLNFGVGMLSDLLLVPGVVALYVALRTDDRDAALLASAFLGLYILIDLTITGIDLAALTSLSQSYASNSTGELAPSVAVANYVRALADVSLPLSTGVLSLGILVASDVLRRGGWSRALGYFGYVTAAVGLAFGLSLVAPPLAGFYGLSAILELLWFAFVGYLLLQRSRSRAAEPVRAPTT